MTLRRPPPAARRHPCSRKSVTRSSVEQNVGVFDFELTDDEIAESTPEPRREYRPAPDKFELSALISHCWVSSTRLRWSIPGPP